MVDVPPCFRKSYRGPRCGTCIHWRYVRSRPSLGIRVGNCFRLWPLEKKPYPADSDFCCDGYSEKRP